jgi:hypothetical protein
MPRREAKSAATAGTASTPATRRSSAKRERINTGNDARFVKRGAGGRFKESDDVGRSQKTDRATKAKTVVKAGYGDQGDQRRKRRS